MSVDITRNIFNEENVLVVNTLVGHLQQDGFSAESCCKTADEVSVYTYCLGELFWHRLG